MIKICLFGPESVGKTTLAQQLASLYDTHFVPEVSRSMVFDSNFTLADIEAIALAQSKAIITAFSHKNDLIICDTDLITTALYSQIYLQKVPDLVAKLEADLQFDHYFLLNIDVPWVADSIRDLGHRRQEIFTLFQNALISRNINYTLVSGNWNQRTSIVLETLVKKFNIYPKTKHNMSD